MKRHNAAQLPVSYLEAAAMAFARDWIAAARKANFLELGDPFNTDAMHTLVRRAVANLADMHERNAARLADLALAGAEDAIEGLKDLIAERHARGLPLGMALGTFDTIIKDRPATVRRPRSHPPGNFLANFIIVCLLMELLRQFPALSLRRSSRFRPSACSIVSVALTEAGLSRGGEEAIRKIWERYGPPVTPGYGWNPKR